MKKIQTTFIVAGLGLVGLMAALALSSRAAWADGGRYPLLLESAQNCACESCGCIDCEPEKPCSHCCQRGCRLKPSCRDGNCRTGLGMPIRKRIFQCCPQCSCEFCTLDVKQTEESKECFKVEQKTICIPPVRLPWMKCDPPVTAKTRVVNVLKTDSYKCPTCEYTWKVCEPEVADVTDE